jgi:hypothetical protein
MGWLGSIINLDGYGHYIHWHFILVGVGNFIVVSLMIVTFVAALLLPFPGKSRRKENR